MSILIINQPTKTIPLAGLGFLIRLFALTNFREVIRQRVEVTTPINSWKRAYEAVYLWNSGLDPYSGNIFHEYPISLQFYKIIISYFNVNVVFAVTDIFIAIILQHSVYYQLILNNQTKETASSRSLKVLATYLFSPITILSCSGMSTSIFTNFLIAVITLILPFKPFRILTCVLCALLACNNIHYSTLILPIFLCLEYCSDKSKRQHRVTAKQSKVLNEESNQSKDATSEPAYYQQPDFSSSLSSFFMICLGAISTLVLASHFLMEGSWSFVNATYLFVLKIQDLTPNIGMFWYFITEMFDQFLEFFTWIVQINAFIHVIPLCIYLRDSPFFALYAMIITSTISQPYPSLANIGLITSLLPQWLELLAIMKKNLVISCAAITCMSIWPLFWHLWIVMGTANANFYFGATLAFSVAMILFLIDLLNAHGFINAKRDFDKNPKKVPESEDERQENKV